MEGMEDLGLKLREEKNFSLEQSGLSKLVFDKKSVKLFDDGFPWKIIDLKLKLDKYVWESQVSEDEYDRLICPAYMLYGKFESPPIGIIYGVIRPHRMEHGAYPEIITTIAPEFNFYIDGFEATEIGVSNIKSSKTRLICHVMNWKEIKRDEITPSFSVKIDPKKSRLIYFER